MARRKHHYKRRKGNDYEIDVTTFLNLMVVLIPFLLITAVFSRLTIVELDLPSNASSAALFLLWANVGAAFSDRFRRRRRPSPVSVPSVAFAEPPASAPFWQPLAGIDSGRALVEARFQRACNRGCMARNLSH